jgi:hypothetical protein
MKIKMLDEKPYGRFVVVTFDEQIPFTNHDRDDIDESYTTAVFTLDELKSFVEIATGHIRDFEILRDDPSNVDTDPPDEYNVFEDEDDHDCKATVDGG